MTEPKKVEISVSPEVLKRLQKRTGSNKLKLLLEELKRQLDEENGECK